MGRDSIGGINCGKKSAVVAFVYNVEMLIALYQCAKEQR